MPADTAQAGLERSAWTPARVFLVASAIYHLPLGIAGLMSNQAFPIGAEAAQRAESALVFGAFETNGWHSLAALLLGIASVYFAWTNWRVRSVALAIGGFHVGIVVSLSIWDPSVFWFASNGADQVIHTGTAVGGLASGLATPRDST
ncbi:MAG TPA: DUF4383 domain-containing protein [Actinomycetota bacterium]|nr:DUF4383 domain-containing protein [Actinomycetota bacterium]